VARWRRRISPAAATIVREPARRPGGSGQGFRPMRCIQTAVDGCLSHPFPTETVPGARHLSPAASKWDLSKRAGKNGQTTVGEPVASGGRSPEQEGSVWRVAWLG